MECRLDAVESKTTQADYESDSESSDSASQIKGITKNREHNWLLAGDGAGNYLPVTQTKNKSINRVTPKKIGLMTGPMDQYNKTIQFGI